MNTKRTLAYCTTGLIVSKFLKDIKNGSQREIRNSIELGLMFSKGQMHKEFFEMAKAIINSSQNPYEHLIKKALDTMDEETLKHLIVNFGVTVFSYGADQIRKHYVETGEELKWIQALDISTLDTQEILSKIAGFNEQGIYAIIFYGVDSENKLSFALDTAFENNETIFFLITQNLSLTDEQTKKAQKCKNIFFAFNLKKM